MPETLQSVFDLPDVSFVDNDTLQSMLERMVKNYEDRYKVLTGKEMNLAPADPMRIALYAAALELYQIEMFVDRAGKQDLLKYSYGEFLDNIAAGRGVTRQPAAAATTILRFTLSEIKTYAVGIPVGTRATNGDGVYFQTLDYAEVIPGNPSVDVVAECTVDGVEGNDLVPGQVNILVDPVAYVESVTNIDTSDGGADLETDESLAERTFLAPSSYSVAGPDDAYVYWTKTYNSSIGSVMVTSPAPGEVDVYILMSDGTIPESSVVTGLQSYLTDGNIRPLTDKVVVKTPSVQSFSINLTYYINRSKSASATTIQKQITSAIAEYITWQTTDIGKDINPSELVKKVMEAGAKRVEIASPVFTTVPAGSVAQCTEQTVNYGGLEDD